MHNKTPYVDSEHTHQNETAWNPPVQQGTDVSCMVQARRSSGVFGDRVLAHLESQQVQCSTSSSETTMGSHKPPLNRYTEPTTTTSMAVQCYSEGPDEENPWWQLSDDGQMAVLYPGGRAALLYATEARIQESNAVLTAQGSHLTFVQGAPIDAEAPGFPATTPLFAATPMSTQTKAKGDDMRMPIDCGVAANVIMQGLGRDYEAVYQKDGREATTDTKTYNETPERTYDNPHDDCNGSDKDVELHAPSILLQQVLAGLLDMPKNTPWEALWDAYQALPEPQRQKLAEDAQLNAHAAPEIGEAFIIASNWDDYVCNNPGEPGTTNFHHGAVVMKGGGDSVTLENYVGPGRSEDDWKISMYGSRKNQSFHEQWAQTGSFGEQPTTMRVRPGSE
ncbi:MAG: hypothetical protein AAFX99_29015 [Myxococcota bacterium]